MARCEKVTPERVLGIDNDDDPDMWHPGPTPSDLRSAIAVRLKPVYKGKTVGVIGRYRNSSGSGPWGNITTATLP